MTLKKRVHELLGIPKPHDYAARAVEVVLVLLIALNVLAIILETIRPLGQQYALWFRWLNLISVVVFAAEYVLRVWSCTEDSQFAHPVTGRLRYAVTPMAIVDLLSFLPAFVPFVDADLRVIRAVRLFRLFRVLKLGRYSDALQTFGRVLSKTRADIVTILMVLGMMLVFASSLMYYLENEDQPDKFSSIPMAMWWAVTTLTTVGYGDVTPVTPLGRLVAAFAAILGIGMFALPTGILGAAFVEDLQSRRREARRCPHCGKPLER